MPDSQIPCSHPIHQEHKPVAVAHLSWPDARRPPVAACIPHLIEAVEYTYVEGDPARIEPITAVTVDARTAGHVLWQRGHLSGYEPGDFALRLIDLIRRADPANRSRLAAAYPEYAAAVDIAQQDGGIEQLRAIAGSGR